MAEGGRVETQRLAAHAGRAHKLALEPGQPTCFLSCGEDGAVRLAMRAAEPWLCHSLDAETQHFML